MSSFTMMFIKKVVWLGCLLCGLFLVPGGISLVYGQEQTPSTPELEAQPNTNQYPAPAMRRRRGFPVPSQQLPSADSNNQTPPPNPEPRTNPVPPASNVAPNNSRVNPGFQSQTPVAANPYPVNQGPVNQGQVNQGQVNQGQVNQGRSIIGPPAPPPATLEQLAPTPAKIVYQNGLLSVDSVNARLIDILNGIRAKTGIQFEGIQATPDRVAGKFGPAPADEVLTSLLQGSRYDYVIIGVPERPSLVQRVILTPSSGAGTVASTPGGQAARDTNSEDEDDSEDASNESAEQAAPQQAQQPGVPPRTTGPKTTEQLLEELKRLQQNQQQNQQQPPQNQPPQAPIKPQL